MKELKKINSWRLTKMGDFLEERKTRMKPDEANSTGLKRLSKIDFSGQIHLAENKPTKTNMIQVHDGDLVISGINVEKGALAIFHGDEPVLATIHYSSYSYDPEKINVEYLRWFLKSEAFRSALKAQVKGGIKTEIKPKHLLPLEVYLPKLEDQKTILNFINSVDADINSLNSLSLGNHQALNKLRQSILQDAIQGKLVPQDPNDEPASELLKRIKAEKDQLVADKKIKKSKLLPPIADEEKPFELPQGWEWCRLEEVCKIITDGTHQTPTYTTAGKPFVSAQNVKPFRFIFSDYKYVSEEDFQGYIKNRKVDRGDVLLTRVGSNIGEAAVVDIDDDFAIYVSVGLLKPFQEKIDSDYLCLWLNSPFGNYHSQANTLGRGVSQGNLNLSLIRSFTFTLPPINEQKKIVKKVSELMQFCDELEGQMLHSAQLGEKLSQSVLQQAFVAS